MLATIKTLNSIVLTSTKKVRKLLLHVLGTDWTPTIKIGEQSKRLCRASNSNLKTGFCWSTVDKSKCGWNVSVLYLWRMVEGFDGNLHVAHGAPCGPAKYGTKYRLMQIRGMRGVSVCIWTKRFLSFVLINSDDIVGKFTQKIQLYIFFYMSKISKFTKHSCLPSTCLQKL